MGCYYEDDDAFNKQLEAMRLSFGKSRKLMLEELCRFKTEGADRFWGEQIRKSEMQPYLMLCRSNSISDYTGDRLSEYIDQFLEGDDPYHMANAAYFILHVCLYKESDGFIECCRKAAKNYDRLSQLKVGWSEPDIITPAMQPDFLFDRYVKETDCGCETSFFGFLTDTLILTCINAIECDGENETFSEKLKSLFEDFPDVFTSAGFFAYFVKDTSLAFDRFEKYTHDPLDYPKLMWVLDGLEFENGSFVQGSPTFFTGEDNVRRHVSLPIRDLDKRWLGFLTEKVICDVEESASKDPYFAKGFLKKFSSVLYHMINPDDAGILTAISRYFRRAAVLAGNPVDFAGLEECGCLSDPAEFTMLGLDIAKAICEGRQTYCFRAMFHFCGLDTDAKLCAVKEIAAYLSRNEHSEEFREYREEFFGQAELFNSGKPSYFDE